MTFLILGLLLFFSCHIVSMLPATRDGIVGRIGENAFKGMCSVIALAGFALIVGGYGLAREAPVGIYDPPFWLRHVTALLMVPVFILLIAAYLPSRIKAAVKHPMLIATKIWAVAHLLANGTLADILLFGSFLIWAGFDLRSVKQRGAVGPVAQMHGPVRNDLIALIGGLALYGAFVAWLHESLIGLPVV